MWHWSVDYVDLDRADHAKSPPPPSLNPSSGLGAGFRPMAPDWLCNGTGWGFLNGLCPHPVTRNDERSMDSRSSPSWVCGCEDARGRTRRSKSTPQ